MSSDERDHSILTSRRKMLAASGSATMLAIAGCSSTSDDADDGDDTGDQGDDHDDSGDDGTGEGSDEPETQEALLLIENVTQEGEVEFNLLDRNDDEAVIADIHGDHWHGEPLQVPDDPDDYLSLGAEIIDEAGDEVELDGSHHGLEVDFADGASEEYLSLDEHGDHVHVIGEAEGETEIVFRWVHDGHTEYETPPLAVDVDHDHGHENGHDEGHDNGEVETFEILDRNEDEEVTAYLHGDHWDGELPEVEEGEHLSLGAYIEDDHGDEIELDGDHYELRVDYGNHAHEDVVSFDYHGDHVHIIGEEEGHTDVVFQLYHDDHVDYETPAIEVEVGHGHDEGHDNGEVETFEILDRNEDEEVTAYLHGDHWHGALPEVEEGEHLSLGAYIEDDHGDEIELDGDHYELRVDYGDHAHEDVVSFDYHGDHVHIIGEEEGHTDVVFELYHDGHTEYTSPATEVSVEHGHEHDDHGHGYEDDVEHACLHFDDHHTGIDEAEPLDGGESQDDPAVVAETHNTYNVSFEGDSTYVMFDVAEYGGGEEFMFLSEEGQVEAIVGEKVEEGHDIEDGTCEYVDMWAVIEPDNDEIVIRLSPANGDSDSY